MSLILRQLLANKCFIKWGQITKLEIQNYTLKICLPATINTPRKYSSYEGDGKTTVSILNRELELGLMINSYSQFGFRLNNEMVVIGPMALFPRSVLSWNISNYEEIDEHSLSLFCVLEPKIDVLVLGIGDQNVTPEFSKRIINYMRKYSINVEVLKTEQACATFNFLNAEGRMVAAALIPPQHLAVNENDLMRRQIRHSNLYSLED